MMRRAYQTDLSDAEWALVEPHLPAPRAPGRPRVHPLREILDAVFYVVRGGCTWRLLPHDLERPGKPSTTIFPPLAHRWYLGAAARGPTQEGAGTPQERPAAQCRRHRRQPESVKTTGIGGEERGYDPGKKVKGRKRHLLVDTQGLVLKAKVHAANVFDLKKA